MVEDNGDMRPLGGDVLTEGVDPTDRVLHQDRLVGLQGFNEYRTHSLSIPSQGLAILRLESRDRDQYKLIVSLVVETETDTLLSSVSISRPRPRLFLFQSRYRD